MKSNSSGISQKSNIYIKLLLLFFALVLGAAISAESKTHFLRLKDIETKPDGLLPKAVVWKNVTKAERSFWPLLILKKADYVNEIEENYPVECRLRISGWGKIILQVDCTEPVITLCWNGQHWYLSENGKIWSTNLKANDMLTLSVINNSPVLYWGDEKVTPYEIGNAGSKIKNSALPVEQLINWYSVLKNIKWLDKILAIRAETNDGIPAVRLIIKNYEGISGASILLPEDTENWSALSLAINKICPDLRSLSQNDFIDATYQGKIMVKNAVQ